MLEKNNPRFAGLCLVWGSVLFLVSLSCGLPVTVDLGTGSVTPPAATVVSTMPAPTLTSTLPAPLPASTATTTGPAAPQTGEVLIYLVAVGDNGASGKQVGCGDSLVPVRREIAPTRQVIAAALNELFAIKTQYLGESGLYNALYQSNLRVASAAVDENGIAAVAITGQVMLGGACDAPRFKGQIEETILSVKGVQSVNILLNGQPIDDALSTR